MGTERSCDQRTPLSHLPVYYPRSKIGGKAFDMNLQTKIWMR